VTAALVLAARDPSLAPPVPFRYVVDRLERKYGQPPGSAASWPLEDFLRALVYERLEARAAIAAAKEAERG
jgi:hypothetical protein